MIDPNPCKGCTERYTACHDYCEKRKKWLEQYHGQQKHLRENTHRWSPPLSASREKAYAKYPTDNRKYKGGNYD